MNQEERRETQAVVNSLNRILYSGNCNDATAALIDPVRCALMAKLPGHALMNAGLKEISYGFSKPIMDIGVMNASASVQQLNYMCSDPAIVMTSPMENDYVEALMLAAKIAKAAMGGGAAGLKALGGTRKDVFWKSVDWGIDGAIDQIHEDGTDSISSDIREYIRNGASRKQVRG